MSLPLKKWWLWCSLLVLVCVGMSVAVAPPSKRGHTSNWAVLVCTSRFWFNYRHYANTLAMYHTVKRLGIPDTNIILMLADDMACNPRNSFAGTTYVTADRSGGNLYGENVEVDFRGYEVTVETFLSVLTDRLSADTPPSKRLMTDEKSNILIYMSGHGGEEFLKFQDAEEVTSVDLANALQQMHLKKRYNEILFIIDTCQGNTLYRQFHSPNVVAMGGCDLNEMSYSLHSDPVIGVATVDRFTYGIYSFLLQVEINSPITLGALVCFMSVRRRTHIPQHRSLTWDKLHAHAGVRGDLLERDWSKVLLTDFFATVPNLVESPPPIEEWRE